MKVVTVLVCSILFNVVASPSEAETLLEEMALLTGQQCSVEENDSLLLVHGRLRHPYNHRHYHPLPFYHPPVYPPYSPYYSPYPTSAICRNQLLFCYMNGALPVGSPCVCSAPFGAVWFSGWVTAY